MKDYRRLEKKLKKNECHGHFFIAGRYYWINTLKNGCNVIWKSTDNDTNPGEILYRGNDVLGYFRPLVVRYLVEQILSEDAM